MEDRIGWNLPCGSDWIWKYDKRNETGIWKWIFEKLSRDAGRGICKKCVGWDEVVDVHKVQSWYAFNINTRPEDFQVEYTKTKNANDFLYAYNNGTDNGLPQVQTWRFEYAKIMSIMGTDVIVSDTEPKKTV